jgi:hypothetical protein
VSVKLALPGREGEKEAKGNTVETGEGARKGDIGNRIMDDGGCVGGREGTTEGGRKGGREGGRKGRREKGGERVWHS